jgi:hypothetical protein
MSVDKSCLFYDNCIQKSIPCFLVPNEIYSTQTTFNRDIFVRIEFDTSKFGLYNINPLQVSKFVRNTVRIDKIYPATSQIEIDYALACMPAAVPNNETHYSDEMRRYEKIIQMFCDFDGFFSVDTFYTIAEFVAYEVTIVYGDVPTRQFMLTLTQSPVLTEQPASLNEIQSSVIRMTRMVFNKCQAIGTGYEEGDDIMYYLVNYRLLPGLDQVFVTYPISLKTLRLNVNFIIC